MIRVSCPKCKATLQVEDKHAGQVIACSTCKTSLQLPQAPTVPPVVAAPPAPPPAPAVGWHYMKNGQQQGPVTADQLRSLIAPADLVWKEGFPQWVAASTVPNLIVPSTSLPPAPPQQPPSPPAQPVAPDASPSVAGNIPPSSSPKDPILMAVLSFFIPWLGQILLGQVTKGVVMLLLTPFLFGLFVIATLGMGLVFLPFIGLIAVIDAYLLAKKLKEGRAIGSWEFFGIESAPILAMPDLLPKATAQGGQPVVPVKPRPPGLMGSAIGMLFVSGCAMMISLLGVVGIVVNESMPAVMQILLALSFIHNAWVIFAILQTMKMQRYAFAITAPLLVMGSWMWLSFSGVPIGLSVMGILGGISVGVWSLGVLRQLEVRAAFENQYDPLETLLPMARATIQGQSPNLEAIKGLAKQLMRSKLALGVAGGVLLILLLVPILSSFGPSQQKSKFLGAAPEIAMNKKDPQVKTGKKGSKKVAQGGNDADLLEFDERLKVLVSRVKLRMSKNQVESLLGFPDDEDEKDLGDFNPAKAGQILDTWTWRHELDSNKFIMIGFVNGTLMDAETNALGQHGWNIEKGYRTRPLGK